MSVLNAKTIENRPPTRGHRRSVRIIIIYLEPCLKRRSPRPKIRPVAAVYAPCRGTKTSEQRRVPVLGKVKHYTTRLRRLWVTFCKKKNLGDSAV